MTIIQCAIDLLPLLSVGVWLDLRFRQVCKDVSNRSLTQSQMSDQSLRNLRTLVAHGNCPSLKKGIAVCLWTLRSCSIVYIILCFANGLTHVVLYCLMLSSMPFFKEDCQLKQLLYRCRKIHQRDSLWPSWCSSCSWGAGAYLPALCNDTAIRDPHNVCERDDPLRTSVSREGVAVHQHLILDCGWMAVFSGGRIMKKRYIFVMYLSHSSHSKPTKESVKRVVRSR